MKKSFKKIFNIVIYISFIISIIGNIIVNRNNILNNNTKILKEMNESTQLTDLNNTLNALQSSHTEYANHIQTSKQKIANAINMYPNNNATENNSLEELSTMITNLTNVPENTYFYQSGTEGDSSTIVRYKNIDGKYYICDSNGVVSDGTAASDVSGLTLIPYSATVANNLSAGSAGYTSGKFYLGDGSDNAAYYAQGVVDGLAQALDNLQVVYTYHVHSGNTTDGGGCYTTAVYHTHESSCKPKVTCDKGPETTTNQSNGQQVTQYYGYCPNCGAKNTVNWNPGSRSCRSCTICGIATSTVTGYSLDCGKTTDTIESVTIVY